MVGQISKTIKSKIEDKAFTTYLDDRGNTVKIEKEYIDIGYPTLETLNSAGQKHGILRSHYSDTNLIQMESLYKNGEKNGPYIHYHWANSAKEQKIQYAGMEKNGMMQGLWISNYSDGQPADRRTYKDDKLHGPCRSYKNFTYDVRAIDYYWHGEKTSKLEYKLKQGISDIVHFRFASLFGLNQPSIVAGEEFDNAFVEKLKLKLK
jgi:antitoxin component YwqK of YwqJK toxin-antitoxin module